MEELREGFIESMLILYDGRINIVVQCVKFPAELFLHSDNISGTAMGELPKSFNDLPHLIQLV